MLKRPSKASRENNASLTGEQVLRIRFLAEQGHTARSLAQFYGVGTETVRRILRRDTWDWLKDESQLGGELPPLGEADIAAAEASAARLKALLSEQANPPASGEVNTDLASPEALAKARLFGNKV